MKLWLWRALPLCRPAVVERRPGAQLGGSSQCLIQQRRGLGLITENEMFKFTIGYARYAMSALSAVSIGLKLNLTSILVGNTSEDSTLLHPFLEESSHARNRIGTALVRGINGLGATIQLMVVRPINRCHGWH